MLANQIFHATRLVFFQTVAWMRVVSQNKNRPGTRKTTGHLGKEALRIIRKQRHVETLRREIAWCVGCLGSHHKLHFALTLPQCTYVVFYDSLCIHIMYLSLRRGFLELFHSVRTLCHVVPSGTRRIWRSLPECWAESN